MFKSSRTSPESCQKAVNSRIECCNTLDLYWFQGSRGIYDVPVASSLCGGAALCICLQVFSAYHVSRHGSPNAKPCDSYRHSDAQCLQQFANLVDRPRHFHHTGRKCDCPDVGTLALTFATGHCGRIRGWVRGCLPTSQKVFSPRCF